jgi:lipoic acid synthetase
MGLKYVVITSVTRDDLDDGGAGIFSETIQEIRNQIPDAFVEVLIPDFQGVKKALFTVLKAKPNVLNHNIETVARLYPRVRPQADYSRSLQLIQRAHGYDPAIPTKSGLMLGLGESDEEITQTLVDMLQAGCRILTLGQYLQPSINHLAVERFIPPAEFEIWRKKAIDMGFAEVASGPFVRSSYHAQDLFKKVNVE